MLHVNKINAADAATVALEGRNTMILTADLNRNDPARLFSSLLHTAILQAEDIVPRIY